MTSRIEDYALIDDCHGAGLVSRDGSLDSLCVRRFDSSASFAAILGDERNGRWQIGPAGKVVAKRRAYRDHTLVLETIFETDTGEVAVIDCMPVESPWVSVVRVVEGRREQAERLFEELLDARNDLVLLAEEYDPRERRQLGNFPQALSHLALIDCAHVLFVPKKSCAERRSAERAAK